MRRSEPKLSVDMPVYNGEPFIEQAMCSILNQSFGDFELIIRDHTSTARTAKICRTLAPEDSRIRFHRSPRIPGAALDYAPVFELSRAFYFGWAHADDVSNTRLHELCLKTLERNSDAVLAYGRTQIIDAEGRVTGDYNDNLDYPQPRACEWLDAYFRSVRMCNVIYGLIRRDVVAHTSLKGDGRRPSADILLIAELALRAKFIQISQVLFYRRIHEAASRWDRRHLKRQTEFWSAGVIRPRQASVTPSRRRAVTPGGWPCAPPWTVTLVVHVDSLPSSHLVPPAHTATETWQYFLKGY